MGAGPQKQLLISISKCGPDDFTYSTNCKMLPTFQRSSPYICKRWDQFMKSDSKDLVVTTPESTLWSPESGPILTQPPVTMANLPVCFLHILVQIWTLRAGKVDLLCLLLVADVTLAASPFLIFWNWDVQRFKAEVLLLLEIFHKAEIAFRRSSSGFAKNIKLCVRSITELSSGYGHCPHQLYKYIFAQNCAFYSFSLPVTSAPQSGWIRSLLAFDVLPLLIDMYLMHQWHHSIHWYHR